MNKTLVRKFILATLVAVSLFLSAVYYVFFTASGLEWYFNRGYDENELEVSIGSVDHLLNGSVSIRDFSLKSQAFHLHFSHAELGWRLQNLLQQKLFIEHLESNLATLRMSRNLKRTHIRRKTLPFVARIETGAIDQLRLIDPNGALYNLANIRLKRIYAYKDLFIDSFEFESDYGRFRLSGNIGVSSNNIINLNTQAALFTPLEDFQLTAKGTIVGTTDQLRFLQKLDAPAATAIEGTIIDPFGNPEWDINTRLELIETKAIDGRWPISSMQGALTAKGQLDKLQVEGNVDITDVYDERWTTDVKSYVKNQAAVFTITATNGVKKSKQKISTSGKWNYTSSQPFPNNLDVATDWYNFRWPTTGKSMLNSPKGEVKFTGNSLLTQFYIDSLQIEPMGIELKELRLKSKQLRGNGKMRNGFSLTGSVVSGQGNLDITGHMSGSIHRLKLSQLDLTGENFSLLRRPEASLVVSPSVSIKNNISHFGTSGYVNVPKATIRLNDLDNAAQFFTSLINPTLNSSKEGDIKEEQLNIQFGENVWFHGYGLHAQVKGNLQFTNVRNRDIIAKGRLHVVNGSYRKAGRKIQVAKGILLYNNMPLDNPELILQLPLQQREKENRIAITGRLKALHSSTSKSTINKSSNSTDGRIAFVSKSTKP